MSVDIEVMDIEDDADEWDGYVDRAPGANPFYLAAAIDLQASTTNTTPYLLAGFKGQEPVGLFPIFEYQKGPFSAVFSPAPQSWTCYLGPAVMNVDKLKQRKRDRRIERFTKGCLEWIDEEIGPVYSQFEAAELVDVRPFIWNGYDVEPGYTYVVDLDTSASTLLDQFSSDARKNVRDADDDAYVIERGDGSDVEQIVEQVHARYESQDRPFHLDSSFARSLYETLPDGAIQPFVCRIDGEFIGGILVVESGATRYRWQGGVKTDVDSDLAINDLLDWHIMRDGLESGIERYDLVGAGVRSINRYKAKFNPRLEPNYMITSGVLGVDLLVDQYQKIL